MLSFRSVIALLFFWGQKCLADKNTMPVFLLDYDHSMTHMHVEPNPLIKLSSDSFAAILKYAAKHSEGVIIFVENTLRVEDLGSKDNLGTPFHYLQQGLQTKNVKYIPAVQDASKTLTDFFPPRNSNEFKLKLGIKLEMSDFKYFYVYFQDEKSDSRCAALRKHDILMRELYFMFRQTKPGPVVAFYTGKVNPSVVRSLGTRLIEHPLPKDLGFKIVSTGALFKFTGVFSTTASSRRSMFNQKPSVAEETTSRRKLSTKMAYFNFEVQFNFTFQERGWTLDNVGLLEGGEEVGRTLMAVGAPWNWSYVCAEPLVLLNTRDGSSITISKYQIQPRAPTRREEGEEDEGGEKGEKGEQSTDSSNAFGEPLNCGPYFTSSIVSCLFVTFLWLAISLYGLVCLFSIHSNDKYDDPLGRQLLAAET